MCSPAGWGHEAEDGVQLSRGGALGAPPASAPFKGGAAGTTNTFSWAVVDFLAELPRLASAVRGKYNYPRCPQIAISRYPTHFCHSSPLPSRPRWTACTAENRPKKGAPGPAAPSRPSEPAAATAPHPSFAVTGCAIASGGAGGVPIPQARGGAATRFRGRRTLPMVRAPPRSIAADEPRP